MRTIGLLLLYLLLSSNSFPPKDTVQWLTNYQEALNIAAADNKPILMLFTGSDWCRPCMQLKEEVIETERFQQEYANHFALVYVDFPRYKKNQLTPTQQKHNAALAEQFNLSGIFPLLVVVNVEEEVVTTINYTPNSAQLFKQLDQSLSSR